MRKIMSFLGVLLILSGCELFTPTNQPKKNTTEAYVQINEVPVELFGKKIVLAAWIGENDIASGSGVNITFLDKSTMILRINKYESASSSNSFALNIEEGTRVTFDLYINTDEDNVVNSSGDLNFRKNDWFVFSTNNTIIVPFSHFQSIP